MVRMKTVSANSGKNGKIPRKYLNKVPEFDRLLLRYGYSTEQGGPQTNALAKSAALKLFNRLMKQNCHKDAAKLAKNTGLNENAKQAAELYLKEKLRTAITIQSSNIKSTELFVDADLRNIIKEQKTPKKIRRAIAQIMAYDSELYSKEVLERIDSIKQDCTRYGIDFGELAYKTLKELVSYGSLENVCDFTDVGRVLGLNRIQLFKIAKEVYAGVSKTDYQHRERVADKFNLIKQRQEAGIEWLASFISTNRDSTQEHLEFWMSQNGLNLNDEEIQKAKYRGFELYLRKDTSDFRGVGERFFKLGIDKLTAGGMIIEAFFELVKTNPVHAGNIIRKIWNYHIPEEVKEWAFGLSELGREDILLTWISREEYRRSDAQWIAGVFGWEQEKQILESMHTQIISTNRKLFSEVDAND